MKHGFPLDWPQGRPRTYVRQDAKFRDPSKDDGRLNYTGALKRLADQLKLITRAGHPSRVDNAVLSSNLRYTREGRIDKSRNWPTDVGAALYFELDGRPYVLACDRWDRLSDNIAAIAAHIDALRGQERWGVADLSQAFAGHVALPAPKRWWQILEVAETATPVEINAAFRARSDGLATIGSDHERMAELIAARAEGIKANA